MKKKSKILCTFLFVISFGVFLFCNSVDGAEKINTRGTNIKVGKDFIEDYGNKEIGSFIYYKGKVYLSYIEVEYCQNKGKKDNGKANIELAVYDSDYNRVKSVKVKDGRKGQCLTDNLKEGERYTVELDNYSKYEYLVYFRVSRYDGYARTITIPRRKTVKEKEWTKINVSSIKEKNTYPKITWKSSNTKVATVDFMGSVKAKKYGKCTITATLNNGKRYSCKITVRRTKPYLRWSNITEHVGGKTSNKLLNAKGKVKWSSTNKKVATVSKKGTIRCKKVGKCTIKAKYKGKIYKCKVKVVRK